MAYDPKIHRRRSLRLKGYDYTQVGAYFVTIVTQNRLCLFGEIVGKEMRLNEAGEMVCGFWEALPQRFPAIEIDMFVVMPNHLHGIVVIKQSTDVGAGLVPARNTNSTEHRATTRVAPTNQNPAPDVENAPNTPNRTTTTVEHTKLTNVGAGLVPARNTNSTEHRATTRVAPTNQNPAPDVENTPTVPNRATTRVAPTGIMDGGVDSPITDRFALGDVIGAYKSLSTVEYTRGVKQMKWSPFHKRLWQRNYYEHVVRHDESLRQLQQYILDNPDQWAFDKENPLAERLETEKL